MFVIEYNKIIISNENIMKNNFDNKNFDIEICACGVYEYNNIKIIVQEDTLNLENKHKKGYNLNELWYNKQQLPITIRNRRSGDVIIVNGIRKKVKDLFIEKKIPLQERDKLLMAVKDDKILNVFGLVKSDEIKNTKEVNVKIYIAEEFYD